MEPNNSINKQQMCLWILSVVATVQVFVENQVSESKCVGLPRS
ncbi:hypothetical protein Hdeb2414_s0024g00648141 [Helianthus debilis subsp. tardiflorus]